MQVNYQRQDWTTTLMDNPQGSITPTRRRRPFVIILMCLVFLLWTGLGWLRFSRLLVDQGLIQSILPTGFYWYLLFSGLAWGLIGLPTLWGLWRGSVWMGKILWIAALFYPLHYWIERLFLWQDPNAQGNWPFMLLLTVLWLGLAFWALLSVRIKHYFDQNHQKGS